MLCFQSYWMAALFWKSLLGANEMDFLKALFDDELNSEGVVEDVGRNKAVRALAQDRRFRHFEAA